MELSARRRICGWFTFLCKSFILFYNYFLLLSIADVLYLTRKVQMK